MLPCGCGSSFAHHKYEVDAFIFAIHGSRKGDRHFDGCLHLILHIVDGPGLHVLWHTLLRYALLRRGISVVHLPWRNRTR